MSRPPFTSFMNFRDSKSHLTLAIAAFAVLLITVVSWLPNLSASLWLDETLTYWVVQGSLAETLERGVEFQSQSGYYVFEWFWSQWAGTSEVALRIPSLLAALGACLGLLQLGKALTGDREMGLLAAVVFASTAAVFREATDARSYMLGLALLIQLALGVIRWMKDGRWRDAWIVGCLAAVLPHFHLFFALSYPAFVLFAFLETRTPSTWRPIPRQMLLVGLLIAVGAALFIPVAMTLLQNASVYSFAPSPRWKDPFLAFAWPEPIAGLLVGIALSGVLNRKATSDRAPGAESPIIFSRNVSLLISIWIFFPFLLLFAVSKGSNASIFIGRYLLVALPAVCLVYAQALRQIESGRARIAAVVIMTLAALALHARPHDDMRGATAIVNKFVGQDKETPVLFSTGLIESQSEAWLRNPAVSEYMISPAAYYALQGNVIALPRRAEIAYSSAEIVDPILRQADRFAAIEWTGNGAQIFPWLIERAHAAGYRSVIKPGFGGVRVVLFRRTKR